MGIRTLARPWVGSTRRELEAQLRDEGARSFGLVRVAGMIMIALCLIFLPLGLERTPRFLLAALCVLVFAPFGMWLEHAYVRRQPDLAHTAFDLTVTWAASMILPQAWYAAMLVAATGTVHAIHYQTRSVVALTAASVAGAMSLSGHLYDVPGWPIPVLAMLIVLPTFDSYHRLTERRRERTDERYDALIDAAAVFFWEVDPETNLFQSVAGNTQALVGIEPSSLINRNWHEVVAFEHHGELTGLGELDSEDLIARITKVPTADGGTRVLRHHIRVVDDKASGRRLVRGVSSDITELHKASELIKHQAEHDPLTGLHNRSVLQDRIDGLLIEASPEKCFAVIVLDLNGFKSINDRFGHAAGDEVLIVIARRLGRHRPETEAIARLGGDEFVVLLPPGSDRTEAHGLSEAICRSLGEPISVAGNLHHVEASIGVALVDDSHLSAGDILRQADLAMYEAKRTGRSIVFSGDAPAGDPTSIAQTPGLPTPTSSDTAPR